MINRSTSETFPSISRHRKSVGSHHDVAMAAIDSNLPFGDLRTAYSTLDRQSRRDQTLKALENDVKGNINFQQSNLMQNTAQGPALEWLSPKSQKNAPTATVYPR